MELNQSLAALLGFAAWSIFLVLILVTQRVSMVLRGQRKPGAFAVDGSDVSPFAERLSRTHANCYENLPAFAAIVLVANVSGHANLINPLALVFLYARLGQSIVNLISKEPLFVIFRAICYAVQLGIMVWWIYLLVKYW